MSRWVGCFVFFFVWKKPLREVLLEIIAYFSQKIRLGRWARVNPPPIYYWLVPSSSSWDLQSIPQTLVPPKHISHIQVSLFTLWQTHPWNWNCIYVGTTNSKPPRPIIMIGQSKTGSSSHVIFITLFSSRRCISLLLRPFTSLSKTQHLRKSKNLSSSDSNVQDHILSTGGDDLSAIII